MAACSFGGGTSTCYAQPSCGVGSPRTTLTVFAAASLQPAFERVDKLLEPNPHITFNFAGTQTLVAQLTQGAPADVFASADLQHMNQLVSAGLIQGQPRVFARNSLEIAVARGNPKGIHGLTDLARPGLVVVLADPSVPVGKYAAQALKNAGITVHPASLEQQVTGVLSKVAIGEADAGIVYVNDIVTSGQVEGVAIPADQNVVAEYPIAVLTSAQNKTGANQFINVLLSGGGQTILLATGFQGV